MLTTNGMLEPFVSEYIVGLAYKDYCSYEPAHYERHETAINVYNFNAGVNKLQEEEADQECLDYQNVLHENEVFYEGIVATIIEILPNLLQDAYQFSIVDGRLDSSTTSFQNFEALLRNNQPDAYPIFYEVNPEIDSTVDLESNMQYCSSEFFT